MRSGGGSPAGQSLEVVGPLWPSFGVEIEGLATDRPIAPETADALSALLRKHLVVLIRNFPEAPVHQLRVTQALGLIVGSKKVGFGNRVAPELRIESDESPNPYNAEWHHDTSWAENPARYTLLYGLATEGRVAPTELLDTSAAYEAVSEERTREIADWKAWHHVRLARGMSVERSSSPSARRRIGAVTRSAVTRFDAWLAERALGERFDTVAIPVPPPPGVQHPVVQFDELTQRRHLYLGEHVWRLADLDPVESAETVRRLLTGIAIRPRVHEWNERDLMVFDSRVLLHRRGEIQGNGLMCLRRVRRTLASVPA